MYSGRGGDRASTCYWVPFFFFFPFVFLSFPPIAVSSRLVCVPSAIVALLPLAPGCVRVCVRVTVFASTSYTSDTWKKKLQPIATTHIVRGPLWLFFFLLFLCARTPASFRRGAIAMWDDFSTTPSLDDSPPCVSVSQRIRPPRSSRWKTCDKTTPDDDDARLCSVTCRPAARPPPPPSADRWPSQQSTVRAAWPDARQMAEVRNARQC